MFREASKKVALVADFGPAYTGLATVGYKLWNGDATQYQARTTTNVAEIRAGTGAYKVELAASIFTADFDGYVEWDTGGSSPVYAYEDIHITAILDHALSDLDTEIDALTTTAAAVKAKTDNLPADPADASDVAAAITAAQTALATAIGAPAQTDDARLDNLDAAVSTRATPADVDVQVEADLASLETDVAAIKAKTDKIKEIT